MRPFVIRLSLLGLLGLCLGSLINAQSADSLFNLAYEIPVVANKVYSDKLRQSYLVTTENELIKYDVNGQELFRYNNNRLGPLGHVDITNPFNILLYYPEYLSVIILDRTLTETTAFNLFDLNIVTDVPVVASSNDNNIWYYDDLNFRLRKIDRKGKVLQESQNMSLVLNKRLAPIQIVERNNHIYLNDPAIGILVFDLFGSYLQTLPLLQVKHMDIVEQQLFYEKAEQLHVFHLQSLLDQAIPFPKSIQKHKSISIQPRVLFVAMEEKVQVYQFE
ncbi:MAG: hypothetical protein AAFP19_24110 [Bacteroidota bacterium]